MEDVEGEPVEGAEGGATSPEESFRRREEAVLADPFDFASNWGEVRLHGSVGNGHTLDRNEVGFDNADSNDLVQDNRNVADDLSLRELGVGLGYARDFAWLGSVEVLGFFYDDQLNRQSLRFLKQDLTVRDPVSGAPTAGYGNATSRASYRYGVGGEYRFPATAFLPRSWDPRGGDGLRVQAQWIDAHDGKLRRDGWYVQGSYRYSFPQRLVAGRYFRSVEPLVRFGELNTDLSPSPFLPGTWDRRQLLAGGLIEITREVTLKVEYAFNDERTGGGGATPGPSSVANDELMVELLLEF